MSDSNREDEGTRVDVLLSAERDDELDAGERAELDALLAADPVARERRAAFADVDEALLDMADEVRGEDGIDGGLATLRARLGEASPGVPRLPVWRRPAVALAVAAAAAFFLYMAVGTPEDRGAASVPEIAVVPEGASPYEPTPDLGPGIAEDDPLGFDEELAIALGYGEGPDLVPGVDNADLSVIESLDLLDFMAAQEEEGRG